VGVSIQIRRDTAANWTSANPVLLIGEIGFETDTRTFKVGNGTDNWTALPYITFSNSFTSAATFTGLATKPSAPSAGQMQIFSLSRANRFFPSFQGPSGLDSPLQPALFANGVRVIGPGFTTALSAFGLVLPAAVGTVSHPAIIADGTLRGQARRSNVLSAATANSASELRTQDFQCFRGDLAGLGGFWCRTRFSIPTTTANQRSAFGLWGSTAATPTTQVPSALTNCIIIGNDSADTTLHVMHNDGSGTATKINCGSNYPANSATAIYDFDIFAPPNSTSVNYRVARLDTAVPEVTGTITTDLPATTTLLAWHAYMNNGGTAAASSFDLHRMYLETDF